ncbi:MAG: hypothetical protein WB609_00890 [Candidatus Cybelea sp.]
MFAATLNLSHIPTVPIEIVRAAPDSAWVIASSIAAGSVAIVTLVLALATLWLALETRRMARQTTALAIETHESIEVAQQATNREDAHHQQSLWPFCVPHIGGAQNYEQSSDIVLFTVENIGSGHALYTQAFLESVDGVSYGHPSTMVGPIAPQKTGPINRIQLPKVSAKTAMTLRLDSTTMFGTVYLTRWSWSAGDPDWLFLDCSYPSIRPPDYGNTGVRRVRVTM